MINITDIVDSIKNGSDTVSQVAASLDTSRSEVKRLVKKAVIGDILYNKDTKLRVTERGENLDGYVLTELQEEFLIALYINKLEVITGGYHYQIRHNIYKVLMSLGYLDDRLYLTKKGLSYCEAALYE